MPELASLAAFALLALDMVLTPGPPSMASLVACSICQAPAAGLVSLGVVFYMLCTALGITALLMAVPYALAYDALRYAGALYLAGLAWRARRPGGRPAFEVRALPRDSDRKLFLIGFVTNLLNPKIAVLYLSLLPQFIDPEKGSVLTQSLVLGGTQIVISVSFNALIAASTGSIA